MSISPVDHRAGTIGCFFLINLIIVAILFSLARLAHPLMVLYGLYGVATIIPNIAIMIRRLHDIGRSGWWLFIYFIPLVGPIIIIVWMATRSAPDNQWGPSNRVA